MQQAYKDKAFWYSKISDGRKCASYYEKKHVLKLKVDEPESGDLHFGTAIHLGVNGVLEKQNGAELFSMYWESLKEKPIQYGRFKWHELKDQGEILISRFERLHAKNYEPVQMEVRLHAEIDGIEFEGTPDFIGLYKGVPSIVDFKTTSYRYDPKKAQCDDQMILYAVLAEKVLGYNAEQVVYSPFIKDKEPSIQTPLTLKLTNVATKSRICNMVEACRELQQRQVYPMNPQGCIRGSITCPFFNQCWRSE